jgi:hypothetical protein
MIKITLEIDNKIAHSCSPVEFVERYILKDITKLDCGEPETCYELYINNYAKIKITEIEQV